MRYRNYQHVNSARLNCAGSDTKIIPSYELEEAYNWLAEQLGTDELNATIVKQLGSWNCYRGAFYKALLKANEDYGWHMAIDYMYEQKHMPPKEIYDDILDRSYMQRDYGKAGVDAAIVKSLTRQGLTEMLSLVIKRTVGVAAWRAYESKSIPTENQYGMDELTEAGDLYDWLTTQWKPTYINKSLIKGLRNDVLYACILDVATENDFVDMERYGNARTAYQYLVEILGEDELNAAIVRHLSKHMSEDELREDLYHFLAVHNLRDAWWDYSKVTRQKMNSNRRRPLRTNASRLNSSVFDYDFNPKDDCYIVIDTVNDNYAVMSSVEAVDDFLYAIADTHDIADAEQFVKDVYNDKDPEYRLVQGLRY